MNEEGIKVSARPILVLTCFNLKNVFYLILCSQLSGISIMSVPAESYSYGNNYVFMVLSLIVVIPFLAWIIVPVFYENNISNCYEVSLNMSKIFFVKLSKFQII